MIATALLPVYLCLFLLTSSPARAGGKDTLVNFSPDSAALSLYHKFLLSEENVYNGREYIPYTATLAGGNPYFQSNDFVKGSVFYDGVLYEGIPLQYDVIKKVLVILDFYQKFRIQLVNEKIDWFTINGITFIHHLSGNGAFGPGFYHTLYKGGTSLLKKEHKTIQEKLEVKLARYVVEEPSYYIKKNNRYYLVDSQAGVLAVFSDKKNELRQYIRQNKLKISDEPEKSLLSIVAYYNTIAK